VRPVKFVIRDRDTKFTPSVDEEFGAEGIEVIRTPVRLTRAHAFAERFVGTVRRECLDLVTHYNQHRPHRSLAQRAPLALERARSPIRCPDATRLRRTDKLGGLVHEYRLAA
jgi:putative transposase